MKKIAAVIALVVVLGGVGYSAYAKTGFGSGIAEGYMNLQNRIVEGFTSFTETAGETLFGIESN